MTYLLFISNIAIAYHYNVLWALLITGAFIIASAMQECNKTHLSAVLGGVVFTVSIGEMELIYMIATVPIFIFDFFTIGYAQYKAERDYIWRMNGGPSSMDRLKFVKGKDGKTSMRTWVGGTNGYYEDSDGKYDKNMIKLKE